MELGENPTLKFMPHIGLITYSVVLCVTFSSRILFCDSTSSIIMLKKRAKVRSNDYFFLSLFHLSERWSVLNHIQHFNA